MATREQLKPTAVLTSATGQSMAGNLTSLPTQKSGISIINYDVSWTGTSPVGTIEVQACNSLEFDGQGNPINQASANWTNVPFDLNGTTVTSLPVSGNTGGGNINVYGLGAAFVQLVYTFNSGTGTLSAIVSGQVA